MKFNGSTTIDYTIILFFDSWFVVEYSIEIDKTLYIKTGSDIFELPGWVEVIPAG